MDERQRKEMFKKTFDTVADGYDSPSTRFFTASVPHLAAGLNLAGDEHILDTATGTGHTALLLAGMVPHGRVHGIDFSGGMLSKAREKQRDLNLDNVRFSEMDMQSLKFPNGYFDVAVCSFGIFFVEDMVAQLGHMAAKVKPGGKVAMTTFDQDLFSPQVDMFLSRIEAYGVEIPPMTWKRTNRLQKCRDLFEAAGLTEIVSFKRDVGYHLPQKEQWWEILWNAGYRGLIGQLSGEEMARFKSEHLAEIDALLGSEGLWLEVNVLYTIGIRAEGPGDGNCPECD